MHNFALKHDSVRNYTVDIVASVDTGAISTTSQGFALIALREEANIAPSEYAKFGCWLPSGALMSLILKLAASAVMSCVCGLSAIGIFQMPEVGGFLVAVGLIMGYLSMRLDRN